MLYLMQPLVSLFPSAVTVHAPAVAVSVWPQPTDRRHYLYPTWRLSLRVPGHDRLILYLRLAVLRATRLKGPDSASFSSAPSFALAAGASNTPLLPARVSHVAWGCSSRCTMTTRMAQLLWDEDPYDDFDPAVELATTGRTIYTQFVNLFFVDVDLGVEVRNNPFLGRC